MQISIDTRGLNKALLMFDERKVRKASRMAINDTARAARTASSKEIRTKFNIKAKDINKRIKVIGKATDDHLVAVIQAHGRPISLSYFGAKAVSGRRVTTRTSSKMAKRTGRVQGVTAKVLKTGSKTRLPHSFIASVRAGKGAQHIGVFKRAGKGRLPIYERNIITVASMFNQAHVTHKLSKIIGHRWPDRFSHHLDRLIK